MVSTSFCSCKDKGTNGISHIKREGRGCTDILALVAFIVSWGIIGAIWVTVDGQGSDPDKVMHPVDMQGRICGISPAVKNQPFGAMPYPWDTDGYKSIICVTDCSRTQSIEETKMSALYPSSDLLGYCLPTPFNNVSISISVSGNFNPQLMDASTAISNGVVDVWEARYVIGGSLGSALVITFGFCVFLKCCAKTLIYSLLFSIVAMGLMLAQFLLDFAKTAQLNGSYSDTTIQYLEYGGYIIMGCTGLFAVVLFFFRNQIDIGVEVTREAARALLDMKMIILFPLIPCTLAIFYFFFFVVVGMHIYSVASEATVPVSEDIRTYQSTTWAYYIDQAGVSVADMAGKYSTQLSGGANTQINSTQIERTLDGNVRNYMAIHVFHFFWVTQFLFYFGYLTFAGAAADWYFTASDEHGNKKRGEEEEGALTNSPVLASVKRVLRYHLGTIAVCAFIIACVKMARLIITYIESKTKGEPPNKLQKAIFCAIKCYLRCLECCLDKINKYALVWTAVYGDGFCLSVCSSFALVWRNLFRVAAVNAVSTIIFYMGKISVALTNAGMICGVLTYATTFNTKLSSPLGPTMMVLFTSYCIATLFFIVFSSTIDTLFLCFLIDSEVNEKGQMMASINLQKLVGKYAKQSKAQAQSAKNARHEREGDEEVVEFHKVQGGDVELEAKE